MGLIADIYTTTHYMNGPHQGELGFRFVQVVLLAQYELSAEQVRGLRLPPNHQIVNIQGLSAPHSERPSVVLISSDEGSLFARPIDVSGGAEIDPVAGDCFVYSHDSRFRQAVGFYGAIALHDRKGTETLT